MHAFRNIVIDLLDDPHGIDQQKYHNLVEFASRNYPNLCEDIWIATDSAESNEGFRVWLDEEIAEQLRTVAASV
jgi:hypothetical protein